MDAGSPGWATPRCTPTSVKRTSPWKLRSEPPKPGACCQRARRALRTYHPSPRGTSPSGVGTISASGMVAGTLPAVRDLHPRPGAGALDARDLVELDLAQPHGR